MCEDGGKAGCFEKLKSSKPYLDQMCANTCDAKQSFEDCKRYCDKEKPLLNVKMCEAMCIPQTGLDAIACHMVKKPVCKGVAIAMYVKGRKQCYACKD